MTHPSKLNVDDVSVYSLEEPKIEIWISKIWRTKALTNKTQEWLRLEEDRMGIGYYQAPPRLTGRIKKYLLYASLPWSFREHDRRSELIDLWAAHNCETCSFMVHRHTMPTGNLDAQIMVVAEAPGLGDGVESYFDRVMVWGPSSHVLRKALAQINAYWNCWFTNLMKCSFPRNRPGKPSEFDLCNSYLQTEMSVLRPRLILLLGRNVQEYFNDRFSLAVTNQTTQVIELSSTRRLTALAGAWHPSYVARKGSRIDEYAEHLKSRLTASVSHLRTFKENRRKLTLR